MRRFIITSPTFSGQAELLYNADGLLTKIDVTQTNMNDMMELFKKVVPVKVADIENAFKASKATVVEADFEVTFEMFWLKYNVKHNKKRCITLWNKLSKTKQVKAYHGIDAYDKYIRKNEWYNKQEPDTYLAKETFENEW